jgi:hypothetical protein
MKLGGVSKKFHLLDVAALSHAHAAGATVTHTARVPAFNDLDDDSSPDVHEAPSPGKTMDKLVSPLPSVSAEYLHLSFTIFVTSPNNFFCSSYPACTLARFAVGEPR